MLFILCIEVVLMMMGIGLVSPILPQYARTFGVNITMVGLLITVFGVARMAVDIPAGRWAERIGRRPILIAGQVVLAVGSAACGLAGSYWQLLVFRMLQGAGSAMYTTAAMIMLADISTAANRGRVMSLYLGSILVGAGLGPVLGGFVGQYFGLQAPFFIFAFFCVLAAIWAYLRLPETRPAVRQQPAPAAGGKSDPPSAAAVVGIKPLLRNLNFILISLITMGIFFMRVGAQNQILPLLASDRLGLKEGMIGMALTVVAVMQLITIFVGGRLSDRFGRKAVITPGCLIAAGSLVMLAQRHSAQFLFLSCVVMGIGIGISGPTPAAYVADIIPRENYSIGMGLYRTISDLGFVIGPVLLGWLADMKGFSFSLFFNSAFLLLAVLLFQFLAREPSHLKSELKS